MKKTTTKKKQTKPTLVVDITGMTDVKDVYGAIIAAKLSSGVAITKQETEFLSEYLITIASDYIFGCGEFASRRRTVTGSVHFESFRLWKVDHLSTVKPNVFKRTWNWLKRLFKK